MGSVISFLFPSWENIKHTRDPGSNSLCPRCSVMFSMWKCFCKREGTSHMWIYSLKLLTNHTWPSLVSGLIIGLTFDMLSCGEMMVLTWWYQKPQYFTILSSRCYRSNYKLIWTIIWGTDSYFRSITLGITTSIFSSISTMWPFIVVEQL